MKLRSCAAWTVFIFALSFVSSAQAQKVTFSSISDAVPGKYFNSAKTVVGSSNPNKLIFGFDTGLDSRTWVYKIFTASTSGYYRTSAMDTMSLVARAPSGYYISRITYSQRGTGSVARTGKASGGSQWVVAGVAAELGLFSTNPTLTRTVDLTGQKKTSVPISITTGLFVFATPSLGSATVSVSGADLLIELLPL